jgi:hypothetical protein
MTTTTETKPALTRLLEELAAGFQDGTRCDGSEFESLKDDMPNRDRWQQVIRECHYGELPNDWRYQTVHRLADAFLERDESDDLSDVMPEIADGLTDCGHSDLFAWLAEHPSRAAWNDEGMAPEGHDIGQMAQSRQYEEIESMGHTLLEEVTAWAEEIEGEEADA